LFDAVGIVPELGGIAHSSAQLSAGLVEKSFRALCHDNGSGASRNFRCVCTQRRGRGTILSMIEWIGDFRI